MALRRVSLFCAILLAACTASRPTSVSVDQPAAIADGPSAGDVVQEAILGSDVTFSLAYIPGGTFTMGSPTDEVGRADDEGPQREVILRPFWMMTHEVTAEAFTLFSRRELDSNVSSNTAITFDVDAVTRPSPPYEDPSHGMSGEGVPASGMTQWAAIQYALWLYEKTGLFFRLPTEAEWEYACRAGQTTPLTRAELDATAWHWDNSGEVGHPVGEKTPNAWGLYDMLGNVSEWTDDQYAADLYATLEDGTADPWAKPTALHPRTVRGGAYDDDPADLRCANRIPSTLRWKRRDPQVPKSMWWNTDSPFVGFRLVRPIHTMNHDEIMLYYAEALGGG